MLNEEHTKLLRDAQRRLGKERVESFLPQPFRVFVSDHDTGCQCWICRRKVERSEDEANTTNR